MRNKQRCSCLPQANDHATLQCPVHQANAWSINDEAIRWDSQRAADVPSVILYPPVLGDLVSFLSLLATIGTEQLQREAVRQNHADGVQYTHPNERRQVA
jgi:hypothetical protein